MDTALFAKHGKNKIIQKYLMYKMYIQNIIIIAITYEKLVNHKNKNIIYNKA